MKQDAPLTVSCEHYLQQSLIGDVGGRVDELQHVGRAVVVSEQQDAVWQTVQPVVRDLEQANGRDRNAIIYNSVVKGFEPFP